jgi:hypothetical protein
LALKLRPSALGSGIDKDRADYAVYCETPRRSRPSALAVVADSQRPMTRSNRVATLEQAKAQLRKSWVAWKGWAKLEEID